MSDKQAQLKPTRTSLAHFSRKCRLAAKRIVREFAREDAMTRREYGSTVKALDAGDDDGVYWFLLWDAIGTRAELPKAEREELAELYLLAQSRW